MEEDSKSNINRNKNISKKDANNTFNDDNNSSNAHQLKFQNFFQAYKQRKDYMSSDLDSINSFDFTIDSFPELIDKLKKNRLGKKFLQEEEKLNNKEEINSITENGLFDTIIEFILAESNIFLYGYGSKLKLIYNFINYFQEKVNQEMNENYHLLIFNCCNSEITLKYILNEILNYLFLQVDFCSGEDLKEFRNKKFKTIEEQICYIQDFKDRIIKNETCGKFLIIFNNIDGPNFQTKTFQLLISQLIGITGFLFLATSDNLYINYFWNQTMKDNFSFYFVKYHTFDRYELEINEKNSLEGEKNLKTGRGLEEVMRSLTKNQRDVIKIMAEIQIKGDLNLMTPKNLVDYMVNGGWGICNNQNRFMDLIHEPIDHEIIVEKILNKNNKQIYKLNLENEILEKIIGGQYEFEDNNIEI